MNAYNAVYNAVLNLDFVFISTRRYGLVRRRPRGEHPGEVSVCSGGVCKKPIPQPAEPLWTPPPPPAVPAHCLLSSHRTAVFCAPRWQDSNWDAPAWHAAVRLQLQLALHAHSTAGATDLSPLQWEWALKWKDRSRRSYGGKLRLKVDLTAHQSIFLSLYCLHSTSQLPKRKYLPHHSALNTDIDTPPSQLHKPGYPSLSLIQRLGGPLQLLSWVYIWDVAWDGQVGRMGYCAVHQQVCWTHFRCQSQNPCKQFQRAFASFSVIRLHIRKMCASICVRAWRILSKGFTNGTAKSTKPVVNIPIFKKRKPEAIKKKTNAKMSWTFAEDVLLCVCISTVYMERKLMIVSICTVYHRFIDI